jgi:hypothetical protein
MPLIYDITLAFPRLLRRGLLIHAKSQLSIVTASLSDLLPLRDIYVTLFLLFSYKGILAAFDILQFLSCY